MAAGASAVSWYVGKTPATPAAAETRRAVVPSEYDTTYDGTASGPFSEAEAIQVVGMRLPRDASGDLARQQLQSAATVTYHSVQHWRVCYDGACWVAHGPGRYAEPENDLARQREGRGSGAP
jgi:hypothetical protein